IRGEWRSTSQSRDHLVLIAGISMKWKRTTTGHPAAPWDDGLRPLFAAERLISALRALKASLREPKSSGTRFAFRGPLALRTPPPSLDACGLLAVTCLGDDFHAQVDAHAVRTTSKKTPISATFLLAVLLDFALRCSDVDTYSKQNNDKIEWVAGISMKIGNWLLD